MLLSQLLSLMLFFNTFTSNEIIDGYPEKWSAFPGDSIALFLNARHSSAEYKLRLFDLAGQEVWSKSIAVFPQRVSMAEPWQDGFGYKATRRVSVPKLPAGVYLWENQIPMVIKSRQAKITVVFPINTINAYSNSGGKSLYGFNSSEKKAATTVSYRRPMGLSRHSEAFFRWMHAQRMESVNYITDQDMDDYNNIRNSKVVIICGHSEYWTGQARRNFDRFVATGKNAIILSGNSMWWQVRYSKLRDQMICYRDAAADPEKSEKLKTIRWFEPALDYPIVSSIGTDFQNAGYGLKNDKGWDGYRIVANSPLLEGSSLRIGDVLPCASDETDGAPLLAIENGIPIIDQHRLGFKRVELVGYDLVSWGEKAGVATWIVFKATDASGTVINTATTDWCSARGIGSSEAIRIITLNMINKLTKGEPVFSTPSSATINN